jgi:hypothetical protein
MNSISPQLTHLPVRLRGEWVCRWNRNLWEGNVSCGEPFVILILVSVRTELLWAKSLPSKTNSLELTLDIFRVSKTEPLNADRAPQLKRGVRRVRTGCTFQECKVKRNEWL